MHAPILLYDYTDVPWLYPTCLNPSLKCTTLHVATTAPWGALRLQCNCCHEVTLNRGLKNGILSLNIYLCYEVVLLCDRGCNFWLLILADTKVGTSRAQGRQSRCQTGRLNGSCSAISNNSIDARATPEIPPEWQPPSDPGMPASPPEFQPPSDPGKTVWIPSASNYTTSLLLIAVLQHSLVWRVFIVFPHLKNVSSYDC